MEFEFEDWEDDRLEKELAEMIKPYSKNNKPPFNVAKRIRALADELEERKPYTVTAAGRPLTMEDGLITSARTLRLGNKQGYNTADTRKAGQLASPKDNKQYRSLFGDSNEYAWNDDSISFFSAVISGRHHPELTKRAMTEGTPSDGGFLIPAQHATKIHSVSLENELVMPRCFVQPMNSNEIDIPAMEIGDHSSNLFGGFTASYVAEAGSISEADPKVRSMTLNAKKLTGMLRFSSELMEDIPGGESQLLDICGKGLSWYRDKAFLKGTGAGEPLGILNANCLVVQGKENSQVASTINYLNLVGMLSKLFAGSFANSIFICHQSTIPAILSLSLPVGTGGSFYPVLRENKNGEMTLLTRPVIFTEKTEVLGQQGDVLLADMSQYVVGLRSGMRFDLSPHVHFSTDEVLARLIERHDGQPLWSEALILEDGSTEVSPFVTLEERV